MAVRDFRFPIGIIVLLIMFCSAAKAEAETGKTEESYLLYKDPKQPINRRISDLMRRMTLEEKIGQMTQIDRAVCSSEVMRNYHIGIDLHSICVNFPYLDTFFIIALIVLFF